MEGFPAPGPQCGIGPHAVTWNLQRGVTQEGDVGVNLGYFPREVTTAVGLKVTLGGISQAKQAGKMGEPYLEWVQSRGWQAS